MPQGVLQRASAELTIKDASAIADNTLEYSVRCVLWALGAPELLIASQGEAGAPPEVTALHYVTCLIPVAGIARRLWLLPCVALVIMVFSKLTLVQPLPHVCSWHGVARPRPAPVQAPAVAAAGAPAHVPR